MKRAMLTTVDNPYDPFDDFRAWFAYDTAAEYHTLSYLARVVVSSYELSEADQELANEQAIDDIVELNPNGLYRKVSRDIPSLGAEQEGEGGS